MFLGWATHTTYGDEGCRVFKWGIQNGKDFCLKVNTLNGNDRKNFEN